jgi:hypothetical protein
MLKRSTYILGIILLGTLLLSVCENNKEPEVPSITTTLGEILIKGENTPTSTMTLLPGTTVRFESIITAYHSSGCDSIEDKTQAGGLILPNGTKLIAQGTKERPIIFITSEKDGSDATGTLVFEETADNSSILEYCEFKGDISIQISNSMTVQYCKFDGGNSSSFISISSSSESVLRYNNFNNMGQYKMAVDIISGSPLFTYNNIDRGGLGGMFVRCASSQTIENNNFTNIARTAVDYMINDGSSMTIRSNYIANCNGKTGVDTIGEQSHNVIYTNPQTSPVTSAGCGW